MATTNVIVIKPGVYSGEHGNALPPAKEGDEIAVFSGHYAASLVADGLVEYAAGWQPDSPEVSAAEATLYPDQFSGKDGPPAALKANFTPVVPEEEEEPEEELLPLIDPDEAETAGRNSVTAVNGIGATTATKLEAAGVYTVSDLIAADPVSLSDETGIAVTRIQQFQLEAAK